MELFLNILWVLVALGVLGAWRVRWVRHDGDKRHHPLTEWTAIGSALVLLFFAISLSDDLHQDVVLFSESSTSRRHSVTQVSGPDSPDHRGVTSFGTRLGLAALPRIAPRASLALFAQVAPPRDVPVPLSQSPLFSGRAPPSLSL